MPNARLLLLALLGLAACSGQMSEARKVDLVEALVMVGLYFLGFRLGYLYGRSK